MSETYKYDIFISYLHTDPNGQEAATYTWVREYFYPELKLWLPHYVPPGYQTQIFFDDANIKVGADWPLALQEAHQKSRCLVAVLSSQYFDSEWCRTELETMLSREKSLGLRTQAKPSGLVYAVVFSGKKFFPDYAQTIQQKDLSKFAYTNITFKTSPKYDHFQDMIKEVCNDLGDMIQAVPPWEQDWPTVSPKSLHRSAVAIPRL